MAGIFTVECLRVHWMQLVGFYRQSPCWKSPRKLVDDIGHGFSYIFWQFQCNGASLWNVSPWKLLSSAVARYFVVAYPYGNYLLVTTLFTTRLLQAWKLWQGCYDLEISIWVLSHNYDMLHSWRGIPKQSDY